MNQDTICDIFAQKVGLPASEIFPNDLTLAEIMNRSDELYNSIDLMEVFAKTANVCEKEYGVQVRLPAFPLDTPISQVLAVFLDEANNERMHLLTFVRMKDPSWFLR